MKKRGWCIASSVLQLMVLKVHGTTSLRLVKLQLVSKETPKENYNFNGPPNLALNFWCLTSLCSDAQRAK